MNRYPSGSYFSTDRLRYTMFLIFTVSALMSGCYTDRKKSPATIEFVVVFRPDVPVEKASSILYEREFIFHEGSDSSRGKKYISETGPKFIVQVPKEKVETFHMQMKAIPQIYEIYQPDWNINKD